MKFLNEIDGAKRVRQDGNNRFVTDVEKAKWNASETNSKAYVDGRVKTDVPLNAKFTDTNTTYSEITTAEIDIGTASTGRVISGRRVKYILDKVSSMITTAINGLTKSSVGLGSVDNVKQATKTEHDSHVGDNVKRISTTERNKWNDYYRGNWTYEDFYVYGDVDTYYPVHITGLNMNQATMSLFEIYRAYNWQAPSTWNTSTHKGGLNLSIDYSLAGWGGQNYELQLTLSQTYSKMVADVITARPDTCTIIVWLRGGGETGARYQLRRQSNDVKVTVHDGVQNVLPLRWKEGTQYEVVYSSTTTIENWFNFTGMKKLLTSENNLYIGGGYRNPKNSVQIYHENNKPSKSDVGLGDVNNTSDINKPVSMATQKALDNKADKTTIPTKLSQLEDDTGLDVIEDITTKEKYKIIIENGVPYFEEFNVGR